jgi:ubiquitin carboxyl-terminal hydrolase L5
MSWCTIESDPGVFSELIQEGLGVPDVSAEEIYSLDMVDSNQLSYGLIFLFKWVKEDDPRPVLDPTDLPNLFFARQIVTNACATQAILSVLMNHEAIKLSDILANLREFTMMIDAESKGIALGNSEEVRIAHNSFARPEPMIHEENIKSRRKSSEDVYHFIAYIPFQNHVYE